MGAPATPHAVATSPLRDVVTVFLRESLPSWREPLGMVFAMLQPLVFLGLFGPLLAGLGGLGGTSPWQWFVPGVLLMLALFGTTGTGYNLLTEIQGGAHERLLVTPMSRSAMLVGRSLKDVVELTVQALLIIAIGLAFGFQLHVVGALGGLVLLAVVGIGVGALSHALALACKTNHEMFYMVQQTLLFPLLFLSGLMLPLDTAPRWMQVAGALNPLTYVADALRALFGGQLGAVAVTHGFGVAVALAVIGLALGARGMRRSTG